MHTCIPNPSDTWAEVELFRWQYGELPASDDMRPIDIAEGMKKMADALTQRDQATWPRPFNVSAVLKYAAKRLSTEPVAPGKAEEPHDAPQLAYNLYKANGKQWAGSTDSRSVAWMMVAALGDDYSEGYEVRDREGRTMPEFKPF